MCKNNSRYTFKPSGKAFKCRGSVVALERDRDISVKYRKILNAYKHTYDDIK